MSVPLRAMLLMEPKLMLSNALVSRQSLQGAPTSKNRRPVGLTLMYLSHRTILSAIVSLLVALEGAQQAPATMGRWSIGL